MVTQWRGGKKDEQHKAGQTSGPCRILSQYRQLLFLVLSYLADVGHDAMQRNFLAADDTSIVPRTRYTELVLRGGHGFMRERV